MNVDSVQTALVTGASSGIGLELAKLLVNAKYHVVITARSLDTLENVAVQLRLAGGEVTAIAADLATAGGRESLVSQINQRAFQIDVLVNNAGFGTHGKFAEIDPAREMGLLEVNILSLVYLTRMLLPAMIERKHGRILNVASTAAFQPGPLMANYYASKAYVLSLSEALSSETRRTGVTVTALCPGPTKTEFQKRAGVRNSKLFDLAGMSAEAVAKAGFDAMMAGRRVCIPGFKNRLLATAVRFAPRRFVLRMVRRLNDSR